MRILGVVPARDLRVRPRRRTAFTLLEVVLSLAIAVVLVAAVFHVMFQLADATESGNRVAAEAQLARTLLDRIAADIQASAAGTGVYNAGLNGQAESLRLFTRVVPGQLDADLPEWLPPPPGNSDLVQINYFLQREDEEDPDSPVLGLARRVRRQLGALDVEPEEVEVTELLAPEVAAVRFRFGALGEWVGFWRGSARGVGCPRAVEITLVIRRPEWVEDDAALIELQDLLDAGETLETDAARGIYRLVVLVPVGADPDLEQLRDEGEQLPASEGF